MGWDANRAQVALLLLSMLAFAELGEAAQPRPEVGIVSPLDGSATNVLTLPVQVVFEAWTRALGETMSKRAIPVRFHDGELLVEVESAVHLQELKNFTGEPYRRQANARLEGEVIRRSKPIIGYLHTGMEKTAETLTFLQGPTNVTRMDYLAPMHNELCYSLAVERLLDVEVQIRLGAGATVVFPAHVAV